MTRLLQSGWFLALIGSVLYGMVTLLMLSPSKIVHSRTMAGPITPNAPVPSWDFFNPEVARLVTDLKQEKAGLAERKQQLDELAARLAAERAELNVVTQAVHRMQMQFDRNFVRVKEEEESNLRRLAKTYSAMSPEGAAGIFKEMDDDEVVKILVFMKDKEAAALLESMAQLGDAETKRVADITERMRTALFRNSTTKP